MELAVKLGQSSLVLAVPRGGRRSSEDGILFVMILNNSNEETPGCFTEEMGDCCADPWISLLVVEIKYDNGAE